MKPLPENQIRVFRIDDNHVAVSAYEHLEYRSWVKVKLEGKNKPSEPGDFEASLVNAWIKAERKQRTSYIKLPDDQCKVEYGDGFILVSAYSKNGVRDWVKIDLTP